MSSRLQPRQKAESRRIDTENAFQHPALAALSEGISDRLLDERVSIDLDGKLKLNVPSMQLNESNSIAIERAVEKCFEAEGLPVLSTGPAVDRNAVGIKLLLENGTVNLDKLSAILFKIFTAADDLHAKRSKGIAQGQG